MTATDIDLDALIDALAARAAARARPLTNAAGDEISQLAAAGLVTVNPGDLITSQWGNLTYGQSNLAFASVADRNNQWAAAADGAVCYTAAENVVWSRRAGQWVQMSPVPGARGWVAQTVGPASAVNCGATPTTVISLTATVSAGRRYRISLQVWGLQQTATGNNPYFGLATATNVDSAQGRFVQGYTPPINSYVMGAGIFTYAPTATGSQTWTMQGTTGAGVLQVAANQAQITLEDMGSQ